MAGYEAILRIKVIADATQAAAGLDKAQAAGGKFGSIMRKAALPAAAAGAAVLALGKKSLDAASDLQQSQGAVETVFGAYSKAVEKSAATADRTMGLSAAQYNQYAALVGTALQNAGMSVKDSVTASNDVMQRGADLSALYGGTTAEAVEAINAAVSRSEFDPLEKYGVTLNQTAINAELAARGQDKLTGAALDTAKKQAALDLVMQKSAKSQGQYAREADSAAGAQQSMNAAMTNAAAALGQILLPVAAKFAAILGSIAKWAQQNTTLVQIFAGAILAIAAAVLVVNAALKVYQATMIVVQAVQKATWLTNPIGLVVIAIIAVVVAITLLWKRSQTFRTIVLSVWKAIQVAAKAVWQAIKVVGQATFAALSAYVRAYLAVARAVFNAVRAVVVAVANAVKAAWNGTSAAVRSAFNAIKSVAGSVANAIKSGFRAVATVVSEVASKIRNALAPAFSALKSAASGVTSALSGPFNAVKSAIQGAINAVESLIRALGRIKVPKISLPKIPGLGRSAPVPSGLAATTAAPTVRGLSATPAALGARVATAGAGIVINVNGAIDPESTARQIRRLLNAHGTRVGLVSSGMSL